MSVNSVIVTLIFQFQLETHNQIMMLKSVWHVHLKIGLTKS